MNAEVSLRHWLALAQTPGIGCKAAQKLLEAFGDAETIFHQSSSNLRSLGLNAQTTEALLAPQWDKVERSLQWGEQRDCHIITLKDPAYPRQLGQIVHPPPVLFIRGQPEVLSKPQLAIVGSRKPTPAGRRLALEFSQELSTLGVTVTSGLALGIDGAAHEGALEAKKATIAVAGTGPDRIYPARHKNLATEIVINGAIVSEFPPGTPVRAQHFPRRNRIISGLSMGTLVIQATRRSGSLITARYALEQGREVMAVPGEVHNPQAKGCNALIREGAKLVETVEDVLEALDLLAPTPTEEPALSSHSGELTDDYRDLLYKIDYAPTPVDRLVDETGLPPEELASMLLILELEGHVTPVAGGCYQRIR